MYKHITKLTEKDKAKILASYRNHAIRSYGMEWDEWAKHIIQKEIDRIFDGGNGNHGNLSQLSSVQYLKAKEAREYFHEKKPEPLEFLIWEDMKADGTVYVPSKMPVRAELKSRRSMTAETTEATEKELSTAKVTERSSSEVSAEQSSTEDAVKKPKTSSKGNKDDKSNKAKKTPRRTAGTATRRAGMRGIDKIRMIAAWAEGMMMPNYEDYEENTRKNNKHNKEDKKLAPTEKLRKALKKATVAIRENPIEFLKDKDFCDLIYLAKNTHGAFRLTASFPASFLKNKGILKLPPLPVKIGKVANIAMATGNDEDMVTFDWFSTDDPNPDRETMLLISDFLGALFDAINAF